MESLRRELARRAKFLAKRDGYDHEMFDGSSTTRILKTAGLVIYFKYDDAVTVLHERVPGSRSKETIFMEGPNRVLVESSDDHILKWAIDRLAPQMVLDDLANT